MSAQLLLNLLNKLGKSDEMRGLSSILSFFHTEFNKFNNTGAQMLVSIYNVTFKITSNSHFWRKTLRVAVMYATLSWTFLRNVTKYVNQFEQMTL